MKQNRRRSRYTKRDQTKYPYLNLAADIIVDALLVVSGQSAASKLDQISAATWLKSETCQRWAEVCGVDIAAAMSHSDSKIKIKLED